MKGKQWLCVILALLLCFGGCAAKSEDRYMSEEMDYEYSYGMNNGAALGDSGLTSGSIGDMSAEKAETATVQTAQKLIRKMDISAETNDMDALLSKLDAKILELGGYLENKSIREGSRSNGRSYRYANLTIRVPAERLMEIVEHISGESNVVSYNESADDITLRYVATESRMTALETEQNRLLELLEKAENMDEILMIEQRLTQVRTELEEVTSMLRVYDNLVDYGTVTLNITEVQEYTVVEEKTVFQRMGDGLKENWEGLCNGVVELFIFLVISLPYLLPLAAVVVIILVVLKRRKRNKKQPVQVQQEPDAE